MPSCGVQARPVLLKPQRSPSEAPLARERNEMPVRLTETAIQSAARKVAEAGERRDLADAACPGLRLRLTPAGAKSWVLACRDRLGRMRRFPLGSYRSEERRVGKEWISRWWGEQ